MSSVVAAMDVSAAVDMTIAWALERSQPDDLGTMSLPNNGTETVNDKIDERRKEQDEVEFECSRLDDVLNRPLKKRDRSGYVTGVGGGVAIKEAFETAECNGIGEASMVEIEIRVMETLKEELKEELREELKEELRAEMASRMNVLFQEKFLTLAKQAGLPNEIELETDSMITPHVPSSYQPIEVNDKEPRSSRLALFVHDPKELEIPKEQSPKRNEVVSGAKSKKFGHNRKGFLKAARLIPTMR
ncbi:hypothetical protein M5689_019226 [Euphorbia peplus]|nr:hypothetical protein M5689_019226 [Euphorbia peplus]